jgi:predicted SAM-dependent methyltransferase
MRHFKRHYRDNKNYITADLESPLADLHFDVQNIPLESESVDIIICNHLLEHVEDDKRAMAELYRILKKGGWGIMLVPEDRSRATTFEDDTITDAEERTRLFGQYDHRRVYGTDYDQRLANAGFRVARIAYNERLSAEQRQLYAIGSDDLVVVYKD